MAFTYTGNPFSASATAQTTVDTVRFLLGDTDENDQQLQDGEITGLLTENASSPYFAAMQGCTVLAARYARRANKSVDGLSIQYADISKHYTDLRLTIQTQAQRQAVPTPYAGGISKSDMEVDREDDDLVQSPFRVGGDDNPSTASSFTQAVPGG